MWQPERVVRRGVDAVGDDTGVEVGDGGEVSSVSGSVFVLRSKYAGLRRSGET